MKGILIFSITLTAIGNGMEISWEDEHGLDPNVLSTRVDDILEGILGYSDLQKYYDNLAFIQKKLNGSEIVNRIANNFGAKFFDRNNAIMNLKTVVKASIADTGRLQECCRVQPNDLEMDNRFKQPIGKEVCQRISDLTKGSTSSLTRLFEDNCAQNLMNMPSLRWQYFASETGVTTLYPAVKVDNCGSYDARFRPFYVKANVPEPKDVVIIIDKSGSMSDLHNNIPLMDIAKEAAKTVVKTLNPHDRVAVIGFSSDVDVTRKTHAKKSCFVDQLAIATKENVDTINQFISEMAHDGSTLYGIALTKAFDYFEKSSYVGERERVILFMSDGEPRDKSTFTRSGKHIFTILKTRNQNLNNSVILMTYGLGKADSNFTILRHMAIQDGSEYGVPKDEDHEAIKAGLFTHVKDPSDLRQEMASYYRFFSKSNSQAGEPIWSLPYRDMWGLGILMSVALPVHDENGHLSGVVGTDLTMEDLLSGAIYFNRSPKSYLFIIDSSGVVIYHPLFEYREDYEVKYTDILALETDENMVEVIELIKKGGSGSKMISSERISPAGSGRLHGVKTRTMPSQVYWKKIPHTDFSVCLVLAEDDRESTVQTVEPDDEAEFLYHRIDVFPPTSSCLHYGHLCAMNQSAVSLGPRAFHDTDAYLNTEESKAGVKSITEYMISGKGGSQFNRGVRNSVWATNAAEKIWKKLSETDLEKFVMWRYVGTKEGIFRVYPGTRMPKEFDPVNRPWYRNAIANDGSAAFSIPYKDARSGRYIISISKVIHAGRKQGMRGRSNTEVAAVMAADILVHYFGDLLAEVYPLCTNLELYRCSLIDSAGFVIFGFAGQEYTSGKFPKHITEVEPLVAESLITKRIMTRDECIITDDAYVQRTYRIIGKGLFGRTNNDCFSYQFLPILGTNAYMVVREVTSRSCENGVKSCVCARFTAKVRRCVGGSIDCECPCTSVYEAYNTCINQYNFSSSDLFKPCVPKVKSIPVLAASENEEKISGLPQCSKYSWNERFRNISTQSKSSNVGVIVGGCIAGVAGLVLIIILVCCLIRRHNAEEHSDVFTGRKASESARDPVKDPLPPPPTDGTYINPIAFEQ